MSVDVAPKRPKTARPRRGEGHAVPGPEKHPPGSIEVMLDPAPQEVGAAIDWSGWYLTDEEDMGHSTEHGKSVSVFKSSLEMLALERRWESALIGYDQFFAWVEEAPLVRVSADVYLVDHPPPPPLPKMWETWRPGISPPRFALEIVSDDWEKDYEQNPPKYDQLGARELVIFDPEAASGSAPQRRRVPLQVYRRQADGSFAHVAQGDGPVRSEELDAWLVVRFVGPVVRLRIALDPAGINLVPTQEEARLAEQKARHEAEQKLSAAERRHLQEQRAREEAERRQLQEQAAREAAEQKQAEAEQKLTAVLAELERLRRQAAE